MRNVKIYYNPYLNSTRLITDGEERQQKGRRVNEFIVGQSLESWLAPYVFSYHKWDGFLPELMADLNDDELDIYFYSVAEFFPRFSAALEQQRALIVERGYSPDLWKCQCIACYDLRKIQEKLRKFVLEKKPVAPEQLSMSFFEDAAEDLSRPISSRKKLAEVCQTLNEAVKAAEDFCTRRRDQAKNACIWSAAHEELMKILNG